MLLRLLKTIQTGEVQSLPEIARTMGISPEMVLRILQNLSAKGYLNEMGADCTTYQEGDPQGGCSACPASRGCRANTRRWFLTEKGGSAIARTLT
jgi:biotin synthase-related radical SAM superfamily protein